MSVDELNAKGNPEMSETPPDAASSSGALRDAAVRDQLLHHFQDFERNFHRDYYPLWLGTLIGPWALTAVLFTLIALTCTREYTKALLTAAAVAFFVAGRFVILLEGLGSLGTLLSPAQMFWMVTYQDIVVALFMAFHVGFLFRVPWIGPKIAELTVDGELILSVQPWMRNVTFLGLVAFIAFPLAATGSVGGAVFGRLLGLSRWATFWGSVIGAVLGNGAMLYLAEEINKYLPSDSWAVRWGGLLMVVGIIVFLERRYAAMKRQFLKDREQLAATGQGPSNSPPPA